MFNIFKILDQIISNLAIFNKVDLWKFPIITFKNYFTMPIYYILCLFCACPDQFSSSHTKKKCNIHKIYFFVENEK